MDFKVGFIGAGNMGSALADAVIEKHSPKLIFIADKDEKKAEEFAKASGCNTGTAVSIARNCKYIFLGVKPQMMDNLGTEIASVLKSRRDRFILVTMAAGLTSETVMNMCGGKYPIIRIMPNTPVKVGEGMVLVSPGEYVTEEETKEFMSLLENAGKLDILNEELIDAGCSLSGCGPAFVFMFIDALAKAGEKHGLSHEQALLYAKQTVLGSAKLAISSEETPEVLRKRVCSPGGSTIEGVRSFEADGLERIVEKALSASYKRNLELKNV